MLGQKARKIPKSPLFIRLSGILTLLVFYRSSRLWRVIVEHAVDAGNLVSDTFCDLANEIIVDRFNSAFNYVCRVDRTDDAEPLECSLAVLDACGLEIGNDSEILPYLACEACLFELFTEDRIRLSDCFESVSCDGTGASYAESGTRERLTVDHLVGKTESRTDHADLILVKILNRLNKLEIEFRRKTSDVVVSLDPLLTFENVWIEGSLDELFADDVTFLLGIGNSCEKIQKSVYCININEVCAELVPEDLADHLRLAFAEETMVNVNADKIAADRLDKKRCNYRRINAAGECEENLPVSNLLFDRLDLIVNESVSQGFCIDPLKGCGSYVCHM